MANEIRSTVIPIRVPIDERMPFCQARRAMSEAFRVWLTTDPTTTDVLEEIEDTVAILRRLWEQHGSGGA